MIEKSIEELKLPKNKPILICLIVALIGFVIPLPYVFYILLRAAIFGLLIWLTLGGPGFKKEFIISIPGLILILALILYNPVFLVHLGSKFIWLLLNAAVILFMLWLARFAVKID